MLVVGMELEKNITFKIKSSECEFRTLNEFDVTHEYIEALEEKNEFLKIFQPTLVFLAKNNT